MKQFQTAYCGVTAFRAAVSEWTARRSDGAVLIHLFSDGAEESEIAAARAVIEEMMPDAVYVGSSASGCICDGSVSTEKLPGMNGEDAAAFAEELRQAIGRLRFEKAGRVTASFGVAQAMPGEEPDPLTARADTALYRAKARGENTVCLAEEIPDGEIRTDQLTEEIPEDKRIRNEEEYMQFRIPELLFLLPASGSLTVGPFIGPDMKKMRKAAQISAAYLDASGTL